MALQESSFGVQLVGDEGKSFGYWQIRTDLFPEMKNKIGNIEAEAEFVATKLVEYGYTDGFKTLALAKYNAPYRPNWDYAAKIKSRFSEAEQLLND